MIELLLLICLIILFVLVWKPVKKAVLGVLDERDVEAVLELARQCLHAHRVQARDRRAGQGGEEGGGALE